MSYLSAIRRFVNTPLRLVGLEVRRRAGSPSPRAAHATSAMPTCMGRLAQMKGLGFSPRVIFDCGAFVGTWSREAAALFPGAQLVLLEPNGEHHERIRSAVRGIEPDPIVLDRAIGEECKPVLLNLWGESSLAQAGASVLEHVAGDPVRQVSARMSTLDRIAEETGLEPDLVKLDLQGYELPALRGAEGVLARCEAVIVEFGCLEAYVGRTTPRELMDFMYDRGFRLYDIVDLIYRPFDGALCAGDFFFVKLDSPLKRYKGYA